jgi:hypothetical protein
LHPLGWLRHAQWLLWLCSTHRLIAKFLFYLSRSMQYLLPPGDLLLLLRLLGLVLGCCCHQILPSCLLWLQVFDTDCRICRYSLRG